MSRVSCRACALAGDQTAGAAGNAPPAAIAVMDFRKSRRFITILWPANAGSLENPAKVMPVCARFACRPGSVEFTGAVALDVHRMGGGFDHCASDSATLRKNC